MIFVGGVHGVGKTRFCSAAKLHLGVDAFSASALIAERKHSAFSENKLIPDIDDNQQHLLVAVGELNKLRCDYLLDGHFCLFDAEQRAKRVPQDTFVALNPAAIVLLTEAPDVIAMRLRQRDKVEYNASDIIQLQTIEISYAQQISEALRVPIHISEPGCDFDGALEFVRTCFWENSYDR